MTNSIPASPATATGLPLVSVVVIGRNEGDRLLRCLQSIAEMRTVGFEVETIYVDSASNDGSAQRAAPLGARVIEVRPTRPSAAVGRNAGWRAAAGQFVLFLDGDTQLHPLFVRRALDQMRKPDVAIVWGHRREAHPEQSIYVRVLDLDWIYAPGPSDFCGGDALVRRSVLQAVGGFDDSLIAGEEPEMCRRIRERGLTILHIDAPMTLHDLAINSMAAYWKRAFRSGHAYAEVASRFASSGDPLWRADARRNLLHGGVMLALIPILALSSMWPWAAGIVMLTGGLAIARSMRRSAWKAQSRRTRLLYALHSHLQQVPILLGQLSYHRDLRLGRRRNIVDYKQAGA
jgi:glycosyltransferase involved in cell wall biosynthesis